MVGAQIGNYILRSELGTGGMGVVYLADHVSLARRAAVKVIRPQFAANEELRQRFYREAQALSAVHHPSIPQIYDFGSASGSAYLVLEYVDGYSLWERLRERGPLSWIETVDIGAQVASALAATHAAGIIHRDLHPGNVLVSLDGRAFVTDFGLVKLATVDGDPQLTGTGAAIGNPRYIAPEQLDANRPIDPRADLYALGATLRDCLAGLSRSPTWHECAEAADPDTPASLLQTIRQLLSEEPDSRIQAAGDVARTLHELQPDAEERAVTAPIPRVTPPAETDASPPGRASRWFERTALLLAGAGLGLGAAFASGTPNNSETEAPAIARASSPAPDGAEATPELCGVEIVAAEQSVERSSPGPTVVASEEPEPPEEEPAAPTEETVAVLQINRTASDSSRPERAERSKSSFREGFIEPPGRENGEKPSADGVAPRIEKDVNRVAEAAAGDSKARAEELQAARAKLKIAFASANTLAREPGASKSFKSRVASVYVQARRASDPQRVRMAEVRLRSLIAMERSRLRRSQKPRTDDRASSADDIDDEFEDPERDIFDDEFEDEANAGPE